MGPWRHSQVNYDGIVARSLEVGWRHCTAISARCTQAFLRSVSEGWRTQGEYAASVHLQHRREPLGPAEIVAAGLRPDCAAKPKPLYLTSGFGLSFTARLRELFGVCL